MLHPLHSARNRGLAALAGLALFAAGPALAQDSTATTSGIPGDALDPRGVSDQCANFVSELSAFQSSFGNTFGVAPLLKAGTDHAPSPNFFNARISANAISADLRQGVPFPRSSYSRWFGPGLGVNAARNSPGTPINTSAAVGSQFAVAFAEFSSDDPVAPNFSYNNVAGGVVSFDPSLPSRLFVTRVQAANNGPDWLCTASSFGLGAVDADGNVHLRADGFGTPGCGPFSPIVGDNYFRVNMLARTCGTLNHISDAGAVDATDWLLVRDGTTHNVPNIVPASISGAASILVGSNFSGLFVHGATAPLTATNAHLGGASDHRGAVGYTIHSFPTLFGAGAPNGTAGILSRTSTTNNRISLFGLGANGTPVNAISRQIPATVTDPETGFSAGGTWGNIGSQTAFRGGTSQLALGRDQAGRLLAAAMVNHTSVANANNHPRNLIAVARVDATTTDWSVAAYTTASGGKPIQDGSGASIGSLVPLGSVSGSTGPSISSPMIDSVGNVYFVGAFQLTAGPQGVGLFRAVYDPVTFSYRLELLLRQGQVLRGANSDRDYLVRFIEFVDADSIDSGAPFSHSIRQGAYNGLDPAGLSPSDPRTLGGLVLNVNVVYDVDDNGTFEDIDDVPGTADQEYNVLLYVTAAVDCNGNGVPDDLDILLGNSSDVNADGIPDECGAAGIYCFGDGSGTPCPCGNFSGPGQGCANSTGQGATLVVSGSGSISAADTVLQGSNLVPGQPGLYFQGNNATAGGAGNVFGDGLRCAGGAVARLQVRTANASGNSFTTNNVALVGGVLPGQVRRYQLWYRDPALSPCGSGFNLTNGAEITWLP